MSYKLTRWLVYIIFNAVLLQCNSLLAQKFIITGKVTDALTGEPIPFAYVSICHATSGTTTDFEGRFVINTFVPGDSLKAQVIGYQSKTKPLNNSREIKIDFQLQPASYNLGTVEIFSGENPAYRIIRQAIRHRPANTMRKSSHHTAMKATSISMFPLTRSTTGSGKAS